MKLKTNILLWHACPFTSGKEDAKARKKIHRSPGFKKALKTFED